MTVLVVLLLLACLQTVSNGLKCEYYNRPVCEREWHKQTAEFVTSTPSTSGVNHSSECKMRVKTCSADSQMCFATWNLRDEEDTGGFPEHRSGHKVQLMGCMDETHQCNDTACHADKKTSALEVRQYLVILFFTLVQA